MLIDAYTANDIEGKELKRPEMIVSDFLPAGLTVLAGQPKLGKSWLALLLCCCVANQEPFLGRQTVEGDCLYLDLEGSPSRMQDRLTQLGYGFPQRLCVAHDCPKMGEGFTEALESWWSETNFPRLIVIDTLARVKAQGRSRMNAYESDSAMFAPLQKFAMEKGIAVVIVTHLKKAGGFLGADEDWLERISGSMGLVGVCDNIWGLFRKRGESTAYLRTSSRDVDAGDMVLRFSDGLWEFVSNDIDGFEFEASPLIQFLKSIDSIHRVGGTELCEQYRAFCNAHSLPDNLSQSQPVTSFGKQLKNVKGELWRIRKNLVTEKKRDGIKYSITEF